MYFIYESRAPGRLLAIQPGVNEVRSFPAQLQSRTGSAVPSAAPAAPAGNAAQPCLGGQAPYASLARPARGPSAAPGAHPALAAGGPAGELRPGEGTEQGGGSQEREDGPRSGNCSLWERMGRTGFSLGGWVRTRGDVTAVLKYVKGYCKERGNDLLCGSPGDRLGSDGRTR